jgi:hypothetical protein
VLSEFVDQRFASLAVPRILEVIVSHIQSVSGGHTRNASADLNIADTMLISTENGFGLQKKIVRI